MARTQGILLLLLALCACRGGTDPKASANDTATHAPSVTHHLTLADGSLQFSSVRDQIQDRDPALTDTIAIDAGQTRQDMVGFGFALTGGSAEHIHGMSDAARASLLGELFGVDSDGIGLSFIRISVGASDLDPVAFSYNDNPGDPEHSGFSLGPHLEHLVPVLGEILAINPDIAIMASPWSAPSWMKDNGSFVAGELLAEHRDTYAAYLVRYVQEMDAYGVDVDFLTIQNEPLWGGNNPSMIMTAPDQALFVKGHLGPAFVAQGLDTKLVAYDQNPNILEYPLAVLGDADAAQYLDGTAFHLYGGSTDDLSTMHEAHPDKHVYFTEQWYDANGDFTSDFHWHMRNVLLGSVRNWGRGVIEWNLSSNPSLTPHTTGGCSECLGAVTIDGDVVTRNAGFYTMAHASRFVRPGSVYLPTEAPEGLVSAAFTTPDGGRVLIVLNDTGSDRAFNVTDSAGAFSTTLVAGAAATFVWGAD